jgi:hypothetical protein
MHKRPKRISHIWNTIALAGLAALLLACSARTSPTPNQPASTAPPTSPPVLPTETQAPEIPPSPSPSAQLAQASPSVAPTAAVEPAPPVAGIEMHRIDAAGFLDQVKASGAYWVRRNALIWA